MRLSPRLSVYVAREVALHAGVGLLAVSVVFVGRNLSRYGAELLAAGAPPADLLLVLRCVVVASLAYTLPIAFLFGVLAGVGRLAADGEALALRSCGLGLRQLALPVLALALPVSALGALLTLDAEPRAKRELRGALGALGPPLEAGRFTRLGDRVVWVGRREGARLERVFAADRSRPGRAVWVFAERGEIGTDPETGRPRLTLEQGDLELEAPARRARIAFETFDLPLEGSAGSWPLRPKDLSTAELRRVVAARRAASEPGPPGEHEVQLERRFALPAAPLILGSLALPLALRRRRAARAWGCFCCAALVLAYYVLLACGEQLAGQGWVPVRMALWAPNALLGGAALALALHARRD